MISTHQSTRTCESEGMFTTLFMVALLVSALTVDVAEASAKVSNYCYNCVRNFEFSLWSNSMYDSEVQTRLPFIGMQERAALFYHQINNIWWMWLSCVLRSSRASLIWAPFQTNIHKRYDVNRMVHKLRNLTLHSKQASDDYLAR